MTIAVYCDLKHQVKQTNKIWYEYSVRKWLGYCRRVSPNVEKQFAWQPYPLSRGLYTRLPCLLYLIVTYKAAVSNAKLFINTAAVHPVKWLFTRQPCPIPKCLHIRLPCRQCKIVIYTADGSQAKTVIYTAAVPQKIK